MRELRTELKELAENLQSISTIKNTIITTEDLEKLEKRLNKRIDDVKKDVIVFCSLIATFIATIVVLIVKLV